MRSRYRQKLISKVEARDRCANRCKTIAAWFLVSYRHPIIVDFSTRLEVLGHLIAIDIGLDQGLQTIRFRILKELRCSPLFLYYWSRG